MTPATTSANPPAGRRSLAIGLVATGLWLGGLPARAGSFDDFFAAIRKDDGPAILALLQRGFDPNTKDRQNQSGLFLAVREGSLKAAKVLIDWPTTEAETRSPQDESPLMMAVYKGEMAIAKALIDKGGDVNKTGWAPLHYAATKGDLAMIALLLDNDAYIDAESPNGTTPLMMAAQYGSTAAVKALLEAGADPGLKNQQGLTAIDFAQRVSRGDAADIIAAFVRAQQPKGKW